MTVAGSPSSIPKERACGTKTCARSTSVRARENSGVPLAVSAVTRLPMSVRRLVTTPSNGAVMRSKPVNCSNLSTAACYATTFAFATVSAAASNSAFNRS